MIVMDVHLIKLSSCQVVENKIYVTTWVSQKVWWQFWFITMLIYPQVRFNFILKFVTTWVVTIKFLSQIEFCQTLSVQTQEEQNPSYNGNSCPEQGI